MDMDVSSSFARALSRHGYPFQYAVFNRASELFKAGKSPWFPLVPEFPVEIQGRGTRIDVVFFNRQKNIYLVCECKRANPSTANWCFARAPRPRDSGFETHSYMEQLRYDGHTVHFELQTLVQSERIFQVALDVKTGQKGDATGGSSDEIEDAATQACRGFNGLISLFAGNRVHSLVNVNQAVGFIPAVFTTANLYSTSAEATSENLAAGDIQNLNPPLQQADWVWYDYPQSPGLKHDVPDHKPSSNLREVFYREFIRRIAFISPSGIDSFLTMNVWQF